MQWTGGTRHSDGYRWGNKLLQGLGISRGKPKKNRGQTTLPWGEWDLPSEIKEIARRFVEANAYNPEVALDLL